MRKPFPPQRMTTGGSRLLPAGHGGGGRGPPAPPPRGVPTPPGPQGMTRGGSRPLPPGHGGEDRALVAVPHGGFQPVEEADVLAPDVHVHEPPQVAVLRDPVAEAVEAVVEAVENLPHGGGV